MNSPLILSIMFVIIIAFPIWLIGTLLPGYQSPKGLKTKHWLKASWEQFLNIFRM